MNLDVFKDPELASEVYRSMLSSMGITGVKRVTFKRYHRQGDIDVAQVAPGVSANYFDIGNVLAGNIVGAPAIIAYTGKAIFEGSLKLTTYIPTMTATDASYSAYLSSGPAANLTHWLFKQRQVTAVDGANINCIVGGGGVSPSPVNTLSLGFVDKFDNVMFNFIRLDAAQTGAGNTLVRMEWNFNGIMIEW